MKPFLNMDGQNLSCWSRGLWLRLCKRVLIFTLQSYPLRQLYSSVPFLCFSSILFLRNYCTIMDLPISSEMIDRFWHSRCLNDRIDLFYMIESFASGPNVSMVAKNGTKKIIPLLSIKSSPVDTCLMEIALQPSFLNIYKNG